MTATVHALTPARTKPVRAFELTVRPDPARPDRYAILIQESYGRDRPGALTRKIAIAQPAQTGHILEHVVAAVRASGYRPTVLGPQRRDPITLDEAAGVRLALALLATSPLSRGDRIRAVADGIAAMSVEETYYWYALCVGPRSSAARRAIRALLSDP
jgi:hypothetical protein